MSPAEAHATIVVVDDDEAARHSIGQMLTLRGWAVEVFSSAEAALAWPGLREAMCIVTDVKMPGMDGEEFLAHVKTIPGAPPVVMITGHGDIAMAVRCLKAGAFDFAEKPFDDDVLLAYVTKAVDQSRLAREASELRRKLILSLSWRGRQVRHGGPKPAPCRTSTPRWKRPPGPMPRCSITGETGVGKELVARAIHAQSHRARGPFVPVNAGALPETMLESELFGHAKGAFTGALGEREGKLLTASGGTLLLDEIETISARAQVQLLRVLDDGVLEPLGSDRPRKVDIRLLCACNVDLENEVRAGAIREDFYHRIMVLNLRVPPLRERAEDVPLLVAHFLRHAADRSGVPVPAVPQETLAEMTRHSWPGNVRELKNAVERMVITARDGTAGAPDLRQDSERLISLPSTSGRLKEEMERVEKTVIETALREFHGEINTTWQALGISRRALYERMKKYGLDRGSFK